MKKIFLLLFLCFFAGLFSCLNKAKKEPLQTVLEQYRADATAFVKSVDSLLVAVEQTDTVHLQQRFLQSRLAYKRIEWLLAYYNPFTAKQINGPAVAEVEPSDKAIVIEPEGFQVIEPFLFPQHNSEGKAELLLRTKQLRSTAGRVQLLAESLQTTDAHLLDALRLQVFRTISLGLSGFDSPIAGNTLAETKAVLQGLSACVEPYLLAAEKTGAEAAEMLAAAVSNALASLPANTAAWNKAEFIRLRLNPLSAGIVSLQKSLQIPFFTEPRPLRADAPTLFADSAFNASFYVPDAAAMPTINKMLLGKKLFYDAVLSDGGKRSCASCHRPEKAFTDGLAKATAFGTTSTLKRNTPTLINAALQPALFYDMRVSFLEDQAAEVIRNRDEMHGDFAKAVRLLQANKDYVVLFQQAYGKPAVSEAAIKNALASYLRSLVKFDTPFDRYMRGDAAALSAQQLQGFNLFMGKAKCGTCHFLPLFNGVNPPEFRQTDAEIIGVPADAQQKKLDSDEGRFAVYKIPLHSYAFKTPTLRNVAVTAPYMHNGIYKTLEEVVDFYDAGGGAGLGLNVPGQTLPADKLNLSADEKKAIVSFLHALTDP